jgi:hypothetical protein
MFYKRPSLRRGGMPTGIDTLSPRVEAQNGFFGQRPLFFGDYRQIGLDFPSTMSGMQIPTGNQVMMKSFPQDASEMGVASVAKTKPSKKANFMIDDFSMSEMPLDVMQTSEEMLEDQLDIIARIANEGKFLTNEQRELADQYGIIYGQDLFKSENRKEIEKQNIDKTADNKIDINEIANNVIRDNKSKKDFQQKVLEGEREFLEESKKDPKIDIKDQPKEFSFDDVYQKEYNRLERLVGGRENEKGMLAIALSDAIGIKGTIADKAAALNKSLLKIVGERKANRRDIAKTAYAATKSIEAAKIKANQVSDSQKNLNRAEKLIGIINNKNSSKADIASAKKELKNLRDAVSVFSKKDSGLSSTDKTLAESFNKLALKLSGIEDKNSDIYKKTYKRYLQARELVARVPELSQSIILNDALAGLTVKKDGGRIGYAMGTPEPTAKDMSNVPAEPVEQNLSFQELRSRLPKEITDDIVRLISDSSQALQDFAYIRTQGDVNKFNMKYGVNLVLPAQA